MNKVLSNIKVLVILYSFFILLFFPKRVESKSYPPPVRVIARADVLRLSYNKYSIVEFVDVYNDDFVNPLVIESITADSWNIRRKFLVNEDWLENRGPITIEPGKSFRVAERKRVIVGGSMNQKWWQKWTKFKITTINWGVIYSNFVSTPFQHQEIVENIIKYEEVDGTTQPQYLSPQQRGADNHYR